MKEKVVLKMALQSDLDLILLTVYQQRLQGFEWRIKDFYNWRVYGALHNLIKTHVCAFCGWVIASTFKAGVFEITPKTFFTLVKFPAESSRKGLL